MQVEWLSALIEGCLVSKLMILALPLLALMVLFAGAPAAKGMNNNPQREVAVVEFTETVKLQGVLLRGQYLIFHDDTKMEAGEPCLSIYTMKAGKRDKLVISIHCEPVARERAAHRHILIPASIYLFDNGTIIALS